MTETTRRVFFAFWPPERTLQVLDALAAEAALRSGGRRMRRETLHMTMIFIGAAAPGRIEVLREIASRIEAEAFVLRLDRLGCWARNRIVWAGCSEVPARQRRLLAALGTRLEAAGFTLEKRPFEPHVTLARNANCDLLPEISPEILWHVNEFVLVESDLLPAGAAYRIIGHWPLQTGLDKKNSKGC